MFFDWALVDGYGRVAYKKKPPHPLRTHHFIALLVFYSDTARMRPAPKRFWLSRITPYVYEAEGRPAGFDYEVAATVLAKLQIDATFRFYPWKRCIAMVRGKTVDTLLDAGKTKERIPFLVFPEEPLSDSFSVLFFRKANPFAFNEMSDLGGKTVGTSFGYQYREAFYSATHFKKEPVATIEQNFAKLRAGRVDRVIVNKYVGLFTAKTMNISDKIEHTTSHISGGPLYLAFARKFGADNLCVRFTMNCEKSSRRLLTKKSFNDTVNETKIDGCFRQRLAERRSGLAPFREKKSIASRIHLWWYVHRSR